MADRSVRVVLSANAAGLSSALKSAQDQFAQLKSSAASASTSFSPFGGEVEASTAKAKDAVSTFAGALKSSFAEAAAGSDAVVGSMDKVAVQAQVTAAKMTDAGVAAGQGFSRGITAGTTEAEASLSRTSELVKGLAGGLLAGFAITGGIEFFKSAAEAAQDDAQAIILVKNEFGDAAESVQRFSDSAANTFGLSAAQANTAAAKMGEFLQSYQITGQAAADMSTSLIGRAADIALKTGSDVTTVESAIEIAMKGRATALKQFGVNVDQAQIKQEAYTRGIATQGATLTDTQKALATYYAIMDQSSSVSGFFANSTDTIAKSQLQLKANLENMAGEIGKSAIPVLTELSGIAVNTLVPAIKAVINVVSPLLSAFGSMPKPLQDAAAAFGGLLLLRGPLSTMFRTIQLNAVAASVALGEEGIAGVAGSAIGGLSRVAGVMAGPWGLAIGAGVTALVSWATSSDDATAKTRDFSSAIDDQTGKLTANADVDVATQVSDAVKAYKEAGGAAGDYTAAVEGNTTAQQHVISTFTAVEAKAVSGSQAWSHYGDLFSKLGITTTDVATALVSGGDAVGALKQKVLGSTDTLNKLGLTQVDVSNAFQGFGIVTDSTGKQVVQYRSDVKDMSDALSTATTISTDAAAAASMAAGGFVAFGGSVSSAALSASKSMMGVNDQAILMRQAKATDLAGMTAAISGLNTAASDAAAAVQGLSINIDILDGRNVPLEDATKNLNAQILAMAQAFKDAQSATKGHADSLISDKGVIDTTTKAGQDLYDSVTAYKGAYDTSVVAAEKAAGAHATVAQQVTAAQKAANGARQAFIDQAVTVNHLTLPAAEALADHMGILQGIKLTPKTLDLEAQDNATAKIKGVQAAMDGLHDKNVTLTVTDKTTGAFTTASGEKGMATGGYVSGPGTATSDSIRARLSDGEFVVRAAQTAKHRNLLEAINAGPGFAGGGHVNVDMLATGTAGQDSATALANFYASIDTKASAQNASVAKAAAAIPAASSGVQQWAGLATQALQMLGQYSPTHLAEMLHQMDTESGGNPAAINNYDINAQNGDPSRGLMQVIMSTFRAYALPGYNSNLYDPLSNMLASINYVMHQYGSIDAGYRGVAYAGGGAVSGPGTGTSDSIAARLSNGEFVVNAAATSRHRGLLEALNGGPGAGGSAYAGGGLVRELSGVQGGSLGQVASTVAQGLVDLAAEVSNAWTQAENKRADAASAGQAALAAQQTLASDKHSKASAAQIVADEAAVKATTKTRDAADALAKTYVATAQATAAVQTSQQALYRQQQEWAAHVDALTATLSTWTSHLADLQSNRASTASSLASNVSGFDGGITGHSDTRTTFATILAGQKYDAQQARQFNAEIAGLRAKGLNTTTLDTIAGAGIDGGGVTAGALAKASKAQIAQLNAVTGQLNTYAGGVGNTVAGAMYDSGIQVAKGFVNGINSELGQIEKAMTGAALTATGAVTKALKIASPSQVMHELGQHTVNGFANGIMSGVGTVNSAMQSVVNVPRASQFTSAPVIQLGEIRVFVGNREITDIARVEVENGMQQLNRAVLIQGSRPQ